MSSGEEFGTDDEQSGNLVADLRKQLDAKSKEVKKLTEQVSGFETRELERSVSTVWDELKVPEPIRGFYTGEKEADAIKKWWEDSKSFFNIGDDSGKADDAAEQEKAKQFAGFADAAASGQELSPGSSAPEYMAKKDELIASIGGPRADQKISNALEEFFKHAPS